MPEIEEPDPEDVAIKNGILLWIEYLIQRYGQETELAREEWFKLHAEDGF